MKENSNTGMNPSIIVNQGMIKKGVRLVKQMNDHVPERGLMLFSNSVRKEALARAGIVLRKNKKRSGLEDPASTQEDYEENNTTKSSKFTVKNDRSLGEVTVSLGGTGTKQFNNLGDI